MTRFIQSLVILVSVCGISACMPEKEKDFQKETIPAVTPDTNKTENFGFYKSFAFCDSNVGYFSQKEADNIYADKTFNLSKEDMKPAKVSSLYSSDELSCMEKNLTLHTTDVKTVTRDDTFPFDRLVFVNNTYLITMRDGYFFVFAKTPKNKTQNPSDAFQTLLNQNLTGLSIIDPNKTTASEKYGTDTVSECMCNAPSLHINTQKNVIIIFNYCDGSKTLNDIEHTHTLHISSMKTEGQALIINTDQDIRLTFTKTDNAHLSELSIQGHIPTAHTGSELKSFYTPQADKFQKATCGDYDG